MKKIDENELKPENGTKTVAKKKIAGFINMSFAFLAKVVVFLSKVWSKIRIFCKAISGHCKIFWHNWLNSRWPKIVGRVAIGLVILLALAQLGFGVMIYGLHSEDKATRVAAKIIPFPVAVSNAYFITYADYLAEKDYIHHFYSSTKQGGVDYQQIDQQILEQLIENRILSQEAILRRVSVPKKDIDASINQIVQQNGGQDQVQKVLNDLYGLNLNQFRRLVKTQLLRDKINNDVIARVKVRHILIKLDANADATTVTAAKTKIDGIATEIKGGLDFAAAATKYSEDSGSASSGGSLDAFARGEMVQEFSDAAFSTPVCSISAPVRSSYGWHIILVEAKTGEVQMSFTDWLASLKKHSLIVRFIKL